MSQRLTFQFTPAKKDYAQAVRALGLRDRRTGLTLGVMCLVTAFAVYSLLMEGSADLRFLPFLLVVPLAVVYLLLWVPARVARQAMKDHRLSSEQTWHIDDEGIRVSLPTGETRLPWGAFARIFETKSQYLLLYAANRRLVQFVPKRALAVAGQEPDFRALMCSHLKGLKEA
jgi:hypothetical protein